MTRFLITAFPTSILRSDLMEIRIIPAYFSAEKCKVGGGSGAANSFDIEGHGFAVSCIHGFNDHLASILICF